MSEDKTTPQASLKNETFGREPFQPGTYTIDISAARDLPVTVNGDPSTFGDAYNKLSESGIQGMPDQFSNADKYVTEDGEVVLGGDWRVRFEIRILANLVRLGISPDEVRWFYYDHDWSQDADEVHTFFAVHGNKVVLEGSHFRAEDPLILRRERDDDPIWHTHPYFHEASERYWYRKFYAETLTGQLMVLRPDEPTLFHYERPQKRDVAKDIELITQVKTYRLLWVVITLLAAVAFPFIREVMGVVAVLLVIDVLYRCWATRKVAE
jgi:hypothetical protein